MKSIKNKTISAIIACYNDGKAIPIMHRRLTETFQKIGCNYEIIFVNDGSPDNSEKILDELCMVDKKTKAIIHTRNFSSQSAFTSGMIYAKGDAVILLDGDLQDPPEIIEEFVKKWIEGYEVVYGERIKRDGSIILQYTYKIFYRLFNKLSYINVPVDAGDFSLMDRKVVDDINNMEETDRFIRGLRAWVGYNQIGVPYHRPERLFGKTTNNIFKNIRWARKGIFSFSYIPLEFISYVAILLVIVSGIASLFYFVSYLVDPHAPRGITTVIILILFLGGVQLLSISIISEYIGKILEETKRRPKYLIKRIINHNQGN